MKNLIKVINATKALQREWSEYSSCFEPPISEDALASLEKADLAFMNFIEELSNYAKFYILTHIYGNSEDADLHNACIKRERSL